MDIKKVADHINVLGDFLGMRDVDALTSQALEQRYGIKQADMLILFGGSIPHGCDVVAEAMKQGIAKELMIVGGEGHTTESLRQAIHHACPEITTEGRMEADVMQAYLVSRYGLQATLLERESTNCGNNITYAWDTMDRAGREPKHIIIVQDATMQRRMDAGFRKDMRDGVTIINYAAYRAQVVAQDHKLTLQPRDLWGMWDIKRYVTLLMGEIPRLRDDRHGYGPKGKGFIAHVDIPDDVLCAFEALKGIYDDGVRVANPAYASK